MPTRLPRKTFKTLTIDLARDYRDFADPLPPPVAPSDWRYQGTITIDGVTGALAWRDGAYGVGIGLTVRLLGVWEAIEIACAVGEADPGGDHVPKFPTPPTWGITWGGRSR